MSDLDNEARVLMDDCLQKLPQPLPPEIDRKLHNLVKQNIMGDRSNSHGRQYAALLLAWYQDGYIDGMNLLVT